MAVTTDSMTAVSSGGVNYDFYGLSKTLNNYTFDEIWDYVFCSSSSNSIYHIGYGGTDVSYYTYQGNDNFVPFELRYVATNHNNVYYHADNPMNNPDGLYMRVIWLQRVANGSDTYIDSSNANQYKLITEFDAKHYVYELTTPAKVNNDYGATSWAEGSYLYYSSGGNLYYYDDLTAETPVRINIPRAIPVIIFKDKDNKGYIIPYRQQINRFETKHNTEVSGWSPQSAVVFKAYGSSAYIAFPVVASQLYTYLNAATGELTSPNADGFRLPEGSGIYSQNRYGLSPKENLISIYACGGNTYTLGFQQMTYFRTSNECKKFYSLMGLHFKADKIYKPIIQDGYVTGFTDDLTTTSDIDNWDGKTNHNVPPGPPSPTPPGDDEDNTDPVSTTGAPFGTGLAHYYVTTVDSAVLGQISEALGTWDIDTSKKDLYRNLISCKILKPPAGIPSTPSTFEIYGVKPQYNGADISIPAVNGNPDITFGPYSISRKFNDFRDYAPYTRAEIFLPYCGWCALPSHVVGRSVSVSYFTDVIAGTVKAVVFCEANPVAEAAGVMAYDIPFAAQNVGAKIQAANTGMLAYGKAALQLSAGIGQAVATKGKQGMSSIVNGAFGVAAGYNQLSMAANENYTEISGKAGDGCALAGIDTIIIKIVRPKYGAYTTPPYVPDGFAHTVGFLSMKQAKVSAASGLILCDNVDTSGIGKATDAERAEIKRVLETGLYVNNPPE